MNDQTQQFCCARHEAMLAKEVSYQTNEQLFDSWVEQHFLNSTKNDENERRDSEPRPTGYYYHNDCSGAHEGPMQKENPAPHDEERSHEPACDDKEAARMGSQDNSINCPHCLLETVVTWSLQYFGLDDRALWKLNEDKTKT